MSNSTRSPQGISAAEPKPKTWLARAFGLNEPVLIQAPPQPARGFDFTAMHRSLTSLERKGSVGE
ncbi:hypothetical protein CU669_04005 [Paramagnetospirillum kuznetsovii]|uniref:Uncharacterized protein n=1 Tax=Paramagnetospirillum kuznetsovii TaxID=2053833 RepID=A0A364P1U8_9PROT|nr:hypothetical protein [Paramagnetospirillum kuznetsovii]RAU23312.1 hypothetical protein CU669_04005 [Paramagnetospirillum kuznetsovii]